MPGREVSAGHLATLALGAGAGQRAPEGTEPTEEHQHPAQPASGSSPPPSRRSRGAPQHPAADMMMYFWVGTTMKGGHFPSLSTRILLGVVSCRCSRLSCWPGRAFLLQLAGSGQGTGCHAEAGLALGRDGTAAEAGRNPCPLSAGCWQQPPRLPAAARGCPGTTPCPVPSRLCQTGEWWALEPAQGGCARRGRGSVVAAGSGCSGDGSVCGSIQPLAWGSVPRGCPPRMWALLTGSSPHLYHKTELSELSEAPEIPAGTLRPLCGTALHVQAVWSPQSRAVLSGEPGAGGTARQGVLGFSLRWWSCQAIQGDSWQGTN